MTRALRNYDAMDEAITRNRAAGLHYFDHETLRFFNGRIPNVATRCDDDSILFVDSIRCDWGYNHPRQYRVGRILPNGRYESLVPDGQEVAPGLKGYRSLIAAQRAMYAMA